MEQKHPGEGKNLLGQLMREGTLSPLILDRLLGAYTLFEYRQGQCFRRHASDAYLKMLYLDDSIAQSFEERDLLEAIVPEDRAAFREILESGSEERVRGNFRRVQRDGRLISLEMEILPVNRDAEAALFCGILRDVTE